MSLQKDIKPSRTPLSHGINWGGAVIFDTFDFLPPTPMLRSHVPFFPRVMSYTESPLWLCSAGSRETWDDNFCPFLLMVKIIEGVRRGLYGFHLWDWFYNDRGNRERRTHSKAFGFPHLSERDSRMTSRVLCICPRLWLFPCEEQMRDSKSAWQKLLLVLQQQHGKYFMYVEDGASL